MKIEKFEEIHAWQEARSMTQAVYGLTRQSGFSRDFGLKDQIRRAAVSVMANIAEGFERRTKKEFRQFLSVALASCAEVKSHLYVALDQEYITQEDFESLYQQCGKSTSLISGFMKYLAHS